MATCPHCSTERNSTEFYDTHRWCKDCLRDYGSARRAANPASNRASSSKYAKNHRAQVNARKRRDSAKNPATQMIQAARQRAAKRGVPFQISEADVYAVWPADNKCPVLGIEFKRRGPGELGPLEESASLDAIVPARGYVPGNIAVISMRANTIKSNVTDPAVFLKVGQWLERQLAGK